MRILIFIKKTLPILFWILISFSFDLPHVAILTAIAAIIHEFGHIIATLSVRKPFRALKNKLSGPKLGLESLTYREEMKIAVFGPLANVICSLLLIPFCFIDQGRDYLLEFAMINLLTAISNLLPINGFDGYKIVYCLISEYTEKQALIDVLYWVSFVISALLTMLSLFFILKLGEGYWTFALFFSIMLSEIVKRQKRTI